MRQVHDEEMRLLLDTADDHRCLAKVGLGMSGRMRQWHEHLAAAPFALPHVILHDGVAAGEPVLIAQPFEHPPRRVVLLAMDPAITLQPAVDDPGVRVILPVLTGRDCRTYATILSFMAGVTPPMPMLGRSLL